MVFRFKEEVFLLYDLDRDCPLLFALPLKWNYVWYSYYELNVLYTLAIGMFAIYCYEKVFIERHSKWYEYILLLFTLFVAVRTIGNYSDYGFLGIVLVFGLYLTRENRFAQASVIAAWGMYFYGIQYNNWYSAWGVVVASILIILYNGKKGTNLKYLFYIFYPAHLLILGIINIVFRFS
ncbi:TraX family protein [Jeotgalibaca sp. MA1X17-3]|uniref:TraX family protein n=1 Tax=Jeotgalibaca sp. MA1X17-3 TaxID=2908211 RepID=UPI002883285F|nr:TraX family protein [Jeotgalibaca sp. MA1X17-3]